MITGIATLPTPDHSLKWTAQHGHPTCEASPPQRAALAFGAWCFLWPVRRGWPVAASLAWFWAVIEIINGLGHPLWSLRVGGYTPGLATAPVLLVLAVYLAYQLRRAAHDPSIAA